MRKVISMLAIAMLVAFTACEKDEEVIEETPSNIPGMGFANGELQVQETYSFPEGIELIGAVGGIDTNQEAGLAIEEGLKSEQSNRCYGSGGRYVKVSITLKNNSDKNRTVFFPRGLVFKVNKAEYQHAMLLQWTWVCVKPQATKTFDLDLYCINRFMNGSDSDAEFSIIGITNSKVMWRLLRMIGWRKINIEHYEQVTPNNALKADGLTYEDVVHELQGAVWSLTNGEGLTEEEIEFIEAIPMLEEGSYPADLDDKTVEPPYYFDEYTPVQ